MDLAFNVRAGREQEEWMHVPMIDLLLMAEAEDKDLDEH
jgi:hypothetical protein